MTIRSYIEATQRLDSCKAADGQTLADAVLDLAEVWEQAAALGYAMMALDRCKVPASKAGSVLCAMRALMADYSIEDAADYYHADGRFAPPSRV